MGSFSYTSHVDFVFMWGVSLTHPMLTLFLCGEFVLHNPCWLHFCACSFSYTSHAVFVFMQGVSLTHPVLASFLSSFFLFGEFLLHIPCCFCFCFFFSYYRGSFSGLHIPCSVVSFLSGWGVSSLTHLVLA